MDAHFYGAQTMATVEDVYQLNVDPCPATGHKYGLYFVFGGFLLFILLLALFGFYN